MAKGMVCAPQPEAVEAGAVILKSGGNAVDAAIATALVQTAVDPFMSGIAGFGSMHVYLPATGTHQCLDFHARAPQGVTEDMWFDKLLHECEDGFGFILKGRVNEIGYKSSHEWGRLNAAIFYNEIDDMQRELNLHNAGAGVVQLIKNTADATLSGVEDDGTVRGAITG